VNSGNAVVNIYGATLWDNGLAPSTGHVGANIEHNAGQLLIYGYIGVGHPKKADIFVGAGGIQVYGAWSETWSPFIDAQGGIGQTSVVTGIRHYSADMNDTNTPKSIVWSSANTLDLDGVFFGNIEVNAGNNSIVIDNGVSFMTHSSGMIPTFTGTAIANQLGYVGMPRGAQRGRLVAGRPPRTDLSSSMSSAPGLEITGREQEGSAAFCTADSNGDGCGMLAYQRAVAGWNLYGNAYFEGGILKSIKAGPMSWLRAMGGTASAGQPNLTFSYGSATAPGQPFQGTTLWQMLYLSDGNGVNPTERIGGNSVHWSWTAPTAGTWSRGDVVYNSSATAGGPMGWMCVQAGTPGIWKAMGNLAP
ncbi:MAG: hypothetical protein AAB834_04300, partial [Patescibacteria group bacterium]